ncbi:MAG TPA: hypothetical protein DEP66_02215 [Acidimicrobiaceae bacterium]|nr:hypothetical protein [Acidimicrobiaceae bacterium]HCB37045.1 hypothetical protein [Acidimicrobiaceae bacterium]
MLEGPRALDGALASGAQVVAVYARPDRVGRRPAGRAGHLYDGPVYEVPARELDDLADAVNPQGVMGVVRTADAAFDDVAAQPRVVLLDRLRNPGNAGAIARSATATGFTGVAASVGTVDLFSPKALRAAAGLSLGSQVCRDLDIAAALEQLGAAGHLRVRAAVDGDVDMRELASQQAAGAAVTLVVGNEAVGPSPETIAGTDVAVSIPMRAPVDSLNVATAAAVLMYALGDAGPAERAPYPAPDA